MGAYVGDLVASVGGEAPESHSSKEVVMSMKRDWALLLSEFTQRNAGRQTRLEVNDPEFGVQVVEEGIVLGGIDYDPRGDRVEIMLGAPGATEQHLTHAISGVSGVDLLRSGGVDHALCVEHQGRRTLLLVRYAPASAARSDASAS